MMRVVVVGAVTVMVVYSRSYSLGILPSSPALMVPLRRAHSNLHVYGSFQSSPACSVSYDR